MMDLASSDLDEKFKFGRNSKNRFNKSKGNHYDIQTQMDDSEDVIEGVDDDTDQ